jgi:DNA-binding CsgD family transcriptional regulator
VDEAVAIWDGAGATQHIARLDAISRAHGIRRRRSRRAAATHGWEALSPKELEVVELVAAGLSNPAIGNRLYISRRTVETHLSHVFTKLGVTNRAQLAGLVVARRSHSDDP